MSTKRLSIHLTEKSLSQLGQGDLSRTINRLIDRFTFIMRNSSIDGLFNDAELDALRNVARGWLAEPAESIPGGLAAEIQDADDGDLIGADRDAILSKLSGLAPVQELALVDSIERHWKSVNA